MRNERKSPMHRLLVTQQYDFDSKTPKAPSQSTTKPVEVLQATPVAASASASAAQPEEKDKKDKKKKPAKEG